MSNYLTKAIKKEWLDKLKSGNYIQTFNCFMNYNTPEGEKEQRCCLAVLATCNINCSWDDVVPNFYDKLVVVNDNPEYIRTGKTDYSNVIPIIEQLETID